jgi:hypothetical protein
MAPTGAVVGTTDIQTLTNKRLDGAKNTFTNMPLSAIDVHSAPYNAVGDYDPLTNTGTDDTVAIQAALTDGAATGRAVSFRAKNYRISATLNVRALRSMTIIGPRSGIAQGGSMSGFGGAWLHYTGAGGVPMVELNDCINLLWEGVGLFANSVADGILVFSDNAPISRGLTFRDLCIYRPVVGVYINNGGAGTESDQIKFDSMAVMEAVASAYRTDSTNSDSIEWSRCWTTMSGSLTDQIHYDLRQGGLHTLTNSTGGAGQDFIRVGWAVSNLTVDTCQVEGSTHVDKTFLRAGATTNTGNSSPITLRNCSPDQPIIVATPSRRLLTLGCTINPSVVVTLSGGNTRWVSVLDSIDSGATISVTGVNARFRRVGEDSSGPPTTGAHFAGEQLLDVLPLTNGVLGWVCTTSGTPGVWVPYGLLSVGGVTPTIATSNGSTAMSITGNDHCGSISFTPWASLGVGSNAVAITFATVKSGQTPRTMITPRNPATAAANPLTTASGSTGFSIGFQIPPGAVPVVLEYLVS